MPLIAGGETVAAGQRGPDVRAAAGTNTALRRRRAADSPVDAEPPVRERSAVARTRDRERLRALACSADAQDLERIPVRYDPTSPDNLAMVAPLEFVRIPGVDRPVMKLPGTTHIPIITDRHGSAANTETSVRDGAVPSTGNDGEAGPIGAAGAHGLEPLDAATAGLGKARRLRLLVFGVVLVGALALATGTSLFFGGTGR